MIDSLNVRLKLWQNLRNRPAGTRNRNRTMFNRRDMFASHTSYVLSSMEVEMQTSGRRGTKVKAWSLFDSFQWGMRTLSISGGEGPHRKVVSCCQSMSLCYLDSNYTCPLSLSPHPSLSSVSLNPRTLDFSVSVEAMRSFLSSFIHLQPPCVSVSITASSILGLTSAL